MRPGQVLEFDCPYFVEIRKPLPSCLLDQKGFAENKKIPILLSMIQTLGMGFSESPRLF